MEAVKQFKRKDLAVGEKYHTVFELYKPGLIKCLEQLDHHTELSFQSWTQIIWNVKWRMFGKWQTWIVILSALSLSLIVLNEYGKNN